MPIDHKFLAASQAAVFWPNTVAFIAGFGRVGDVKNAYTLLLPCKDATDSCDLQSSYQEHAPVIWRLKGVLTTVSDGPIKWEHGRGRSGVARGGPSGVFPERWRSAHIASADVALMALQMLAEPIAGITDPRKQWAEGKRLLAKCWKSLAMPIEEVADWQERIYCERAKLLQVSTAEGNGEAAKLLPAAGRGGNQRVSETTLAAGEDHLLPEQLSPQPVSAIARLLGEDKRALETFLRRYRDKFPDCFECFEGVRKNEPTILYRMSDVWPEVQAWKNRRLEKRRRSDD